MLKGEGESYIHEEVDKTFWFPIMDPKQMAEMKNIPPSILPHYHGMVLEYIDSFSF